MHFQRAFPTNRRLFVAALLLVFISAHFVETSKKPAPGRYQFQGGNNIVARPDYLQACPDVKDTYLQTVRESTATIVDRLSYISFAANLTRPAAGSLKKAVFFIRKCSDSADPGEQVQTWRFGRETCGILSQKGALWSPIFQRIYPRVYCPLQEGTYELRNATVDMSKFQVLPLEITKHYWRGRIEFYDNVQTGCVEFGGKFVWMGKH